MKNKAKREDNCCCIYRGISHKQKWERKLKSWVSHCGEFDFKKQIQIYVFKIDDGCVKGLI